MKRKSAAIWGCLLILLIVGVITIIGSGVYFSRQPNFDNFLPAFSSPVQVRIVGPPMGSSFPADSYIPIHVKAEGELPIQSVELWINGGLFGTQAVPAQGMSSLLTQWYWQPGTVGNYTLLARAIDSNQHASVSEVLTITVTAATGYTELITSETGDSFVSLAEKYGTTPEKILQANPQLSGDGQPVDPAADNSQAGGIVLPPSIDINLPLPPESTVYIPQLTTPILSKNFLPQVEEGQTEDETSEPPSNDQPAEEPPIPSSSEPPNFFDKFAFQVNSSVFPDTELPAAPTVSLWTSQSGQWPFPCHPKLQIIRNSKNEAGYFVYRSGGRDHALKRIATLDKVKPGYGGTGYADMEDLSGVFTYVVSAYNTLGESFSEPLVIDLSKCDYVAATSRYTSDETVTGGVGLENNILTLPESVDLAYLYVGINDVFWQRVPPGSSSFLSGSGYQFSLDKYLASLIGQIDDTDLDITIEVWGWQGGKVGLIGTYKAKLHRAVLMICSQEGENQCQNGSAPWGREVSLSTGKPIDEQSYNLQLTLSSALKSEDLEYEVFTRFKSGQEYSLSSWRFCDYNVGQCGDLASLNNGGTVYLPFLMAPYYNLNGNKEHDLKNIFWYNEPFNVYIRIFPVDQQGNRGIASNTVVLHYNTPPEGQELLPLASNLPSLYTVEILEDTYQPPVFLNPVNWGCVIVQNNAAGYVKDQAVCPPPRDKGPGNWDAGSILGGEADLISEGMSDLSAYFEQVKDSVVGFVASFIPGCGEDCKAVLKKGLEAGIVALTGIPPTVPNFDELSSQGILYAVDQVQSSITGYECGEACVTALKGQLTDMVHRARQIDSQPGCTAVDQVAWTFGKEPGWCLPPEVEVIPYPGGSNQPGVIFVRVTRTSTPAPSGDPREQYFLDIATQGTNGQTQGELYNKVRIAMPLLEPGASMVIPIPLGPLGHDNTKDVYMPQAGTDGFANFKSLFYKGTSTITASEYCYVAENNTFVPCTQGGTDTFTTVNPLDPSEQWP